MPVIKLKAIDILEKDFQVDYKGYDAEEVDRFLDIIAGDYQRFEEYINQTKEDMIMLKAELETMKSQLKVTQASLQITAQQKQQLENIGLENSDLIDRINRLERESNNHH